MQRSGFEEESGIHGIKFIASSTSIYPFLILNAILILFRYLIASGCSGESDSFKLINVLHSLGDCHLSSSWHLT